MKGNQIIQLLNCLNGRNKGRPVGPEIRTGERDREFPARAHRSGCSEKAESKGRFEDTRWFRQLTVSSTAVSATAISSTRHFVNTYLIY